MNSSSSVSDCRDRQEYSMQQRPITLRFSRLHPGTPISQSSFSEYSSRLNQARAFPPIEQPHPSVLSCCPLFMRSVGVQ